MLAGPLMRLGWASLVLVHLFPIAKVFGPALYGQTEALLSLLTLLASTVFFVLKAADVAWLRLPKTAASRVAFVLIVALLHREAIGPSVEELASVAATATVVWTHRVDLARGLRRLPGRVVTFVLTLLSMLGVSVVVTPALATHRLHRARGPPLA